MISEAEVIAALETNLRAAGIGAGSCIQVHCGIADLLAEVPAARSADFARRVVMLLLNLVGGDGTVLMSTDAIRDPREFAYRGRVFDADRMPSRRGTVTEIFRQTPGVLRSRHPWCNASAWGRHAAWLLADHLKSRPFAMDRNSPWYKLTELDADIVYIGEKPHAADLCVILPQHVMGNDYPVGCFLDKPVRLRTRLENGDVDEVPVQLDVHDWSKAEVIAFIRRVDREYGLHRSFGNGATAIVQCKAAVQLQALMAELERGHAYPHMRYWV
jgi:aminoglycoside N3'-acetyltransferase